LENFKQLESSQKDQKNTKEDKTKEQLTYADKKNQQKKIKKLQNRINKLEKEIATLEQSQKSIDADLANPEKFKELSQKDGFFDEYEKNRKKLQDLEGEWELAVESLELIK
jgi:ATP-binding cassette subfamily F protein 3